MAAAAPPSVGIVSGRPLSREAGTVRPRAVAGVGDGSGSSGGMGKALGGPTATSAVTSRRPLSSKRTTRTGLTLAQDRGNGISHVGMGITGVARASAATTATVGVGMGVVAMATGTTRSTTASRVTTDATNFQRHLG